MDEDNAEEVSETQPMEANESETQRNTPHIHTHTQIHTQNQKQKECKKEGEAGKAPHTQWIFQQERIVEDHANGLDPPF